MFLVKAFHEVDEGLDAHDVVVGQTIEDLLSSDGIDAELADDLCHERRLVELCVGIDLDFLNNSSY